MIAICSPKREKSNVHGKPDEERVRTSSFLSPLVRKTETTPASECIASVCVTNGIIPWRSNIRIAEFCKFFFIDFQVRVAVFFPTKRTRRREVKAERNIQANVGKFYDFSMNQSEDLFRRRVQVAITRRLRKRRSMFSVIGTSTWTREDDFVRGNWNTIKIVSHADETNFDRYSSHAVFYTYRQTSVFHVRDKGIISAFLSAFTRRDRKRVRDTRN